MLRSAGGAVGADDEVRAAQGVEVRRVVGGVEDAVEQLAELLGRRRRIDVEHGVQGLGGRHVVGLGADAADAGRQVRHVLGRPAHAELLEAAQLGDLQVGVGHVALVVEEDVDLAVAFQPGDRIDRNAFHSEFSSSIVLVESLNHDGRQSLSPWALRHSTCHSAAFFFRRNRLLARLNR